jgi:hypothetical protein
VAAIWHTIRGGAAAGPASASSPLSSLGPEFMPGGWSGPRLFAHPAKEVEG